MSDAPVVLVRLLRPGARLPERATPGSSGYDLYACLESGELEIGPEPVLVPTGVAIEAPLGLDVQVRPRSGLSARGVMVVLGTIDSDYRGELLVTMYVLPHRGPHTVRHGDRVAQMVISRSVEVTLREAGELTPTERATGGHGSTGS
ncbi:MAG TPA: dUTP diphosphatase [Dehalococcoidia bacterium]|nr:dUTP diphosphatase [Dehalococcoidia bacterium]